MPTFYRTHAVRITHRSMRVFDPEPAVYLIGDLGPVWVVAPVPPRTAVRVCCSSGAMAVVVLVSTQWQVYDAGWIAALLVLGTAAALPVVRRPVAPADHALVATCRGEWVRLYSTSDPVEFGRVRRALQRAIEWHDEAAV